MESLIQLDRDAMNRLIGLLFKERPLWDKEHVAYAVPGEMKLAYQRISDAMAMRGLDAARVWAVIKNIRLLYLKELKKIRIAADEIMMLATAAKVQGVVKPTPPMYVPTIWWFPMMEAMFEDKAIKCMNSASYSTMATTSYRSALNTMVIILPEIVKTTLKGEKILTVSNCRADNGRLAIMTVGWPDGNG